MRIIKEHKGTFTRIKAEDGGGWGVKAHKSCQEGDVLLITKRSGPDVAAVLGPLVHSGYGVTVFRIAKQFTTQFELHSYVYETRKAEGVATRRASMHLVQGGLDEDERAVG